MGIVQENLANKPMPEVQQTEHGVTYVKAATETPIEPVAQEKVETPQEPAAPVAHTELGSVPEVKAEKPVAKKKGGRPKKSDKKKK